MDRAPRACGHADLAGRALAELVLEGASLRPKNIVTQLALICRKAAPNGSTAGRRDARLLQIDLENPQIWSAYDERAF
ncbi:MAG: hypothetical protein ACR2PF_01830 [Rhizobiaceae bacterium]